MAAPSNTVWGSVVGDYGRIGISRTANVTNASSSVTVEVWFWGKYSVSDSSNVLYYDVTTSSGGSASTSKGAVSIKTSVATGSGWSTSNQVKLATYTHTYTRGTSNAVKYIYARLANVDIVGGTMSVSTTYTVTKLSSYKVTYNANGGSGAPSAQTKYYGTNITLSSTKPTRTGYSFLGWATSATATAANSSYDPGDTYSANAPLTLYAVWKANTYAVTYNANGGSGAPSAQTKTYGVSLKLQTSTPTRANYNFLGWATSSTATSPNASYDPGDTYTGNAALTLYAVWELAYTEPRITDVSIKRCTSAGVVDDEGTSLLLSMKWATDKTVTVTQISYKEYGTTGSATVKKLGGTGTSGTITNRVCYTGELSADKTYTITITVSDASGTTYVVRTLNSAKYIIDISQDGMGLGKAAELVGGLDIGYVTRHSGGLHYLRLDDEVNLNDIGITAAYPPNTYLLRSDRTYANYPINGYGAVLEVMGSDSMMQRLTSFRKDLTSVYVRFYYSTNGVAGWGDWVLLHHDTGWKNATLKSEFAVYNDNSNVHYRKIGNVVYIAGIVKPTAALEGSATQVPIFNLPEGYRPSEAMYKVCPGSAKNTWLLAVLTSGNVTFSRYGMTTYAEASTSVWLPFEMSFVVD